MIKSKQQSKLNLESNAATPYILYQASFSKANSINPILLSLLPLLPFAFSHVSQFQRVITSRSKQQFENILEMSDQFQSLKTHLSIVKQLPADKIQEQFYNLMVRAKDTLGETHYQMAYFYYEYGNFIIAKLEKNIDIFNADAVPNNVHQEAEEELDQIAEAYDDSQTPQDQVQGALPAKGEENAQAEEEEEAENDAPEAGENEVDSGKEQPQEEEDDKEISLLNMEFAIRIYEQELEKAKNGQTETPMRDVLDGLRRAHTRLGDLFMLDQEYAKAVDQYRFVIAQEEKREDAESNRLIAELHFLIGNCFLYDNKPGCENLAIQEFIKAVNILINNLSLVEHYDVSGFEVPEKGKYQVDRFAYLNKPMDNPNVKEIKEVITCLLDKIEDTSEQIGVKAAYERQIKKEEQEKKKSEFKPVQEGTKIINLGVFGKTKKKPEEPKPAEKEQEKKQAEKKE